MKQKKYKTFQHQLWNTEWILLSLSAYFFSPYIFYEFLPTKNHSMWKKINKVLIILFLFSRCLCFLFNVFLSIRFGLWFPWKSFDKGQKKLFKIQLNVTYSFLVSGFFFFLLFHSAPTVFIRSRMFGLRVAIVGFGIGGGNDIGNNDNDDANCNNGNGNDDDDGGSDGGCELLSTMKRFHSEKDEIVAAKLRSSSWKSVDNEFQLIHTFFFLLSIFIALKHSTLNVHKKKESHRFLFLCLSACSLSLSFAPSLYRSIQSGQSLCVFFPIFITINSCSRSLPFVLYAFDVSFVYSPSLLSRCLSLLSFDTLDSYFCYCIYMWTDMHKRVKDTFWSVLCFLFLMMLRFF